MLLSGSRDKTLIVWNLTRDDQNYGYPKRSLHGHSHIVSDCVRNPEFPIAQELELIALYRSSHQTVPTPSPLPGTRLSASGNSPPVPPPAASSATTTTSSPSLSPPTTARSCPDQETAPSSCGTPWATASSPSPTKVIPNGCRASASARTLRTPSS